MKKLHMHGPAHGVRIAQNDRPAAYPPAFLSGELVAGVRRFHASVAGYRATPLASLDCLAQAWGLGGVYVKDESYRFGMNAFKSLGGLYAIFMLVCERLGLDPQKTTFDTLRQPQNAGRIGDMVFVTATDGNHGKGVAWAAAMLGCQSVVYMPKGSVEARAQAIRDCGAREVTITNLNYDAAVRLAARHAEENGWHLVQDTAWPGYEDIPNWISQGYTTMASEALDQLALRGVLKPSHVFLQAGVGSMSGGVLGYLANVYGGDPPIATICEPETVACIFQSACAGDGQPHAVTGELHTIMAGLNCGEPNTATWPILRDFAAFYASCPDWVAAQGMRVLGNPYGDDPRVISGESGAVGMGLLSLLCTRPEYAQARRLIGLDADSHVLLFSTEGDTDPEGYREIVHEGKYPAER